MNEFKKRVLDNSNLFYLNIAPNLPPDLYERIKSEDTFLFCCEADEHFIILKNEKINITKFIK